MAAWISVVVCEIHVRKESLMGGRPWVRTAVAPTAEAIAAA